MLIEYSNVLKACKDCVSLFRKTYEDMKRKSSKTQITCLVIMKKVHPTIINTFMSKTVYLNYLTSFFSAQNLDGEKYESNKKQETKFS